MPREPGSAVTAGEILRTGALAAAVALAGAVVYYGPAIATGRRVFFTHDYTHSDIWHLNFPIKQLYDQALAGGRLPLWAPELGTGFPLLAQGEVGALYPPNLLLYAALPVVLAFNWSVLLHAGLAAAFAAMLARQLATSRTGGVLAGIVFAFCGFLVVHVKHPAMAAAAAWSPALLLCIERYRDTRSARSLAALALCTAVSLLTCHPQIAYYTLLVAAAWAAASVARAPGRWTHAARLLWAAILGVALAAPQVLPTYELTSLSRRGGGLAFEQATEWRYNWSHLVLFLQPHAFGDPARLGPADEPLGPEAGFRQVGPGKSLFWEVTGYVGILPLVLAAAALVLGWRRPGVWMCAALAVLALLLALGPSGGLYQLAWYGLPGFDYFRSPGRLLVFVDLALALLAGTGWTLVEDRAGAFAGARMRRLLALVVIAVCFADSKLALGGHNSTVATEAWLAPPVLVQRIAQNQAGRDERFRILGNDAGREVFLDAYRSARGWHGDLAAYEAAKNTLAPNLSALWGLDNLEFFFPLYPRWMGDTIRMLAAPRPGAEPQAALWTGRIHQDIASLFNVRYLIDAFALNAPTWVPLASHRASAREIRLLANDHVLPRAWLVPQASFVHDSTPPPGALSAPMHALLAPGFDPRREVSIVVAEGLPLPARRAGPPGRIDVPVEIVSYGAERVRLRTKAPSPCWLVLSDTFYPGWRAQVNGAERTIERANVSMRAIELAGGPAEIELRYEPAPFRRGLWIAGVAALLTLTLPLQLRRRGGATVAAIALGLGALSCGRDGGPDAAVGSARAQLTDVTAEMGLLARASDDWPDGTFFLPEIMGPGLALFDYDGDGDLDLLQLRTPLPGALDEPAPDVLWRQDPGGAFRDVTATSGLGDPGFGQGVAIGDVDNDGDLDVYLASYGPDAFYVNRGDGSFENATVAAGIAEDAWSAAATFCDYDRDGLLDLYVANYLRVDYGGACRSGSGAPDYCGPASFDGLADKLWRNEGGGRFREVSAQAGIVPADGGKKAKGLGVVCLDLTGDGWPDFFVANDGEANHLWVNRHDGTFAEEATARGLAVNRHGRAEANMGIAVGDVDRDGRLDLLVSHLALENNTLYRGLGRFYMDRTVEAGMGQDDLPYTGFGCTLFDREHDGDLDFAVVNGAVRSVVTGASAPGGPFWSRYAEPALLFDNDGSGRFSNAAAAAGEFASSIAVARGLAVGDLDGDGDLDLAVSNVDNTIRVWRNDAPRDGRHHLLVRAVTGRRDAIGAVVTVRTPHGSFVGAVLPGASYQSSSDLRVHFGLGATDTVERLELLWPDGSREAFTVDAVDREVVVHQGQGAALDGR